MRRSLLDRLVCPYHKDTPLRLFVFSERFSDSGRRGPSERRCEWYCALFDTKLGARAKDQGTPTPSPEDCASCEARQIVEGILVCRECGRWYPIVGGIPRVMPDELRDRKLDLKMLARHSGFFRDLSSGLAIKIRSVKTES